MWFLLHNSSQYYKAGFPYLLQSQCYLLEGGYLRQLYLSNHGVNTMGLFEVATQLTSNGLNLYGFVGGQFLA